MEKHLAQLKKQLLGKRFLLINDGIDKTQADEIDEKILSFCLQNNDPIRILFRTTGGDVSSALKMHDSIISAPVPCIGYVINRCSSAGIYPLLACKERIGLPDSRYLFHSMKTTYTIKHNHPFGVSIEEQFQEQIRESVVLADKKSQIMSNLKIPLDQAIKLEQRGDRTEKALFAQEALEIGLLTGIYSQSENPDWIWQYLK